MNCEKSDMAILENPVILCCQLGSCRLWRRVKWRRTNRLM
ncbi:hypothetical protein EDP1_3531 [Pseudomonas putida S610]|nr:hypothetical protein EDP1_3531 [Pseudomonas putida S610]